MRYRKVWSSASKYSLRAKGDPDPVESFFFLRVVIVTHRLRE